MSIPPSLRVAALALATLTLGGLPARADVPVFVDGPIFAALCTSMGEAAQCPSCKCEALTSTPSIGVTSEASSILHGLLVEVRGVSADGTKDVHEVHVVLGDDKKLIDGGVVVRRTAPRGEVRAGSWEYRQTRQVYDMCPGACDWDAVGQVHLFELYESWSDGPLSTDPTLQYEASTLVACFEKDRKPGCWQIELAMKTREATLLPDRVKPKLGKQDTRQRSWKIGGRSGTELVLGAYTGSSVRTFHERSGREVKKKTLHFAELTSWDDASALAPSAPSELGQ